MIVFDEAHLHRIRSQFTSNLQLMEGSLSCRCSATGTHGRGTVLGTLAVVLGGFIKLECARLDVPVGSGALLLGPVDASAEGLCQSCGLHGLLPGVATTGSKL